MITANELLVESADLALNETKRQFDKKTIFTMSGMTKIMEHLNRTNAFGKESLIKLDKKFNIGVPNKVFQPEAEGEFSVVRGKNNSYVVTIFGKLVDVDDSKSWMGLSLQLTYGEQARNLINAAYIS
jgi:hypothetical protein